MDQDVARPQQRRRPAPRSFKDRPTGTVSRSSTSAPRSAAPQVEPRGVKLSSSSQDAVNLKPFPAAFRVAANDQVVAGPSSPFAPRDQSRAFEQRDQFERLQRENEERGLQNFRVALKWVERLSEGPVERDVLKEAAQHMKPSHYQDVVVERHATERCGYPLCPNPPSRPYDHTDSPVYRLDIRRQKVYDVKVQSAFCSETCRKRSEWFLRVCLGGAGGGVGEFLYASQVGDRVELLEEVEERATAQERESESISYMDATPTAAVSDPPNTSAAATSQVAADILARLKIREHDIPTHPPAPPTASDQQEEPDWTSAAHRAREGADAGGAAGLLPFDSSEISKSLGIQATGSRRRPRAKRRQGDEMDVDEAGEDGEGEDVQDGVIGEDADAEVKAMLSQGMELRQFLQDAGAWKDGKTRTGGAS